MTQDECREIARMYWTIKKLSPRGPAGALMAFKWLRTRVPSHIERLAVYAERDRWIGRRKPT